MKTVFGYGTTPNDVFLFGEAPGWQENVLKRPFVGDSGQEQRLYLAKHGVDVDDFYLTNLVKEYIHGNPSPTPEQLDMWTEFLEHEIAQCQPRIIIAAGAFAARWILGDSIKMYGVHGTLCSPGEFDESLAYRAPNTVVIPIYHPAQGIHDPSKREQVFMDYGVVAKTVKRLRKGKKIKPTRDKYRGNESYHDVTGTELSRYLESQGDISAIALDTEATHDWQWAVQISIKPGVGYVLRVERDDFDIGARAIEKVCNNGAVLVLHNATTPSCTLYDVVMCELMGINLPLENMFDTMYAAYLLHFPQGLKDLMHRLSGMQGKEYKELVGNAALAKQIRYILSVSRGDWPGIGAVMTKNNDGTEVVRFPQSVQTRARGILRDIDNCKVDKDGNFTDPLKRWEKIDDDIKAPAVKDLGPMPKPTMFDVDFDDAMFYSARDPDGTLRAYPALKKLIKKQNKSALMKTGMRMLAIIHEMEKTGMPGDLDGFVKLRDHVDGEMSKLQTNLSQTYCDGLPFNPKSAPHVCKVLTSLGLKSLKKTKTGQVSTARNAIIHLRSEHPFIDDVFTWRELHRVKTSDCEPVIKLLKESEDNELHCTFKSTRTPTRRLASKNPNLLAVPKHGQLGKRIRSNYVCTREHEVFAGWDFSQMELACAAHLSRDEVLCQRFINGDDVHTFTASEIFGVSVDDVDHDAQRTPAKRASFLILYGGHGEMLAEQLRMMGIKGWSVDMCKDLINNWLGLYAGVRECVRRTTQDLAKVGKVVDYWGMDRILPGIWANDRSANAQAGRHAFSHRVQGLAQGMMQESMVYLDKGVKRLQRKGEHVRWCLQIHDEVIFRMDERLWPVMDPLVRSAMVENCGIKLRVPVRVEGGYGRRWSDI